MNRDKTEITIHPKGESEMKETTKVELDTFGGKLHIEWDPQAAVTPMGQLSFFVEYLKTAELLDPWVEECPLIYTSPNSPGKRNVLGTVLLSILAGHKRYAQITSIRMDAVNPELLGMDKVVSEDCVRRAFLHEDANFFTKWQLNHLHRCWETLLYEPWILDVDTTVKPLYGRQEGAEIGYNPKKPGRPSHVYHTYMIANVRLILDAEVQPGNQSASSYTRPHLYELLEKLPPQARPSFIRGDCGFGNEGTMHDAEIRGINYLFKLRLTQGIKTAIKTQLIHSEWRDAGQGWEGTELPIQLSGWSCQRRGIILRRALKEEEIPKAKKKNIQPEFDFGEASPPVKNYEYAVLVTSLKEEIFTIRQFYCDRADSENVFDELKNQWSWGGFTTHDLSRCQIMVRHAALIYNWWSLFVRLIIPDRHAEAITSRPLLLYSVGKKTTHAGQTKITVTSMHRDWEKVKSMFIKVTAFLGWLRTNAEQLDWHARWRLILSKVFSRFLNGRILQAPKFVENNS
jgi:hypothetical protein